MKCQLARFREKRVGWAAWSQRSLGGTSFGPSQQLAQLETWDRILRGNSIAAQMSPKVPPDAHHNQISIRDELATEIQSRDAAQFSV